MHTRSSIFFAHVIEMSYFRGDGYNTPFHYTGSASLANIKLDNTAYLNTVILCVGHLLVAGTNGQRVLITSVVPNQSLFCPREEVNITCVTRGSPTLTWTSNEYNKDGGNSLTLASFNQLGYSVRSPVNSDTIATLINKSNNTENGEQVLVSQLRIITLANFSISSITCLHDDGSMNSTGVQVLGKVYDCITN